MDKRAVVAAGVVALGSLGAHDVAAAADWTYDSTELARFALEYEQARSAGSTTSLVTAAHVSYFQGFVNGVLLADFDRRIFCLPANATMGQAWMVVAKFLRENPEQWTREPSDLVEIALARAFQCK